MKGSLSFAGAQIPPNPIPPFVLRFNARSGATGQNPKGTVTDVNKDGSRFVRRVTCLRATGGDATVGVVAEPAGAMLFGVRNGRSSVGFRTATNPPTARAPARWISSPASHPSSSTTPRKRARQEGREEAEASRMIESDMAYRAQTSIATGPNNPRVAEPAL